MKRVIFILIFACVLLPGLLNASETLSTDKVTATVEDNGDWILTELDTGATWYGQWYGDLMKVWGTDGTCFFLGQSDEGLVQYNCMDLEALSILFYYN